MIQITEPEGAGTTAQPAQKLRNRFDRYEVAGAFGDLGTFIPFVIGYIVVTGIDPLGILFTFGIMLICTGLYYKTPVPVQPMKAIGAAAVTQVSAVTPGMVWGAGIFTGIFWLVMGLTGMLDAISKFISKPVVKGIVLGLGLSFIVQGIRMMQSDIILALIALALAFALLTNKRVPAMFVLVIVGVASALIKDPGLYKELSAIHFDFQLPYFALGQVSWQDFVKGALILGIAQVPLTFGNAVIAITAENNRLFPERPVTEKKIAVSQGIMNLFSPLFGGVPVCHGAGGLAGHVRFGARTGGGPIILGVILIAAALCFSSSVMLMFNTFPSSVLGVILFFAGLELAVSARDVDKGKGEYYILLVTAGFAFWNMGAGFVAGIVMQEMLKRKVFKV